jgi:hypothetical protein
MVAINGAGMSFLIPQFWPKEWFYVSGKFSLQNIKEAVISDLQVWCALRE